LKTEPSSLKGDREVVYFVCIVLALALGILYTRWRRYIEIRTLKQRHRCKDPAKYPHKDRMGSDLVRLRAEAMKEGRFSSCMRRNLNSMARHGKRNGGGRVSSTLRSLLIFSKWLLSRLKIMARTQRGSRLKRRCSAQASSQMGRFGSTREQ
jgi:hypothetical protein